MKGYSDKMQIDCERGQMTKGKGFKSKQTIKKVMMNMNENESETGIVGDESKEQDSDVQGRW